MKMIFSILVACGIFLIVGDKECSAMVYVSPALDDPPKKAPKPYVPPKKKKKWSNEEFGEYVAGGFAGGCVTGNPFKGAAAGSATYTGRYVYKNRDFYFAEYGKRVSEESACMPGS
jgi:hypothetical protein